MVIVHLRIYKKYAFFTLAQDVDKLQDLYGKIKSEIMQQKTDFLTLIDIQEKERGRMHESL